MCVDKLTYSEWQFAILGSRRWPPSTTLMKTRKKEETKCQKCPLMHDGTGMKACEMSVCFFLSSFVLSAPPCASSMVNNRARAWGVMRGDSHSDQEIPLSNAHFLNTWKSPWVLNHLAQPNVYTWIHVISNYMLYWIDSLLFKSLASVRFVNFFLNFLKVSFAHQTCIYFHHYYNVK